MLPKCDLCGQALSPKEVALKVTAHFPCIVATCFPDLSKPAPVKKA